MRQLGRAFLRFLRYLGQLAGLVVEVACAVAKGKIRWKLLSRQIFLAGVGSQAVIIVTGAFTGAVFGAQMYFQFARFGVESIGGAVVSIAMCRELAPVLVGLMVAGRVGAAITAEIGSMKVTEQIDALRSMGVHPVDYLVVPRALALMISMPFLIAEAIIFGVLASWIVTVYHFQVPEAYYWKWVERWTEGKDFAFGMIKGFINGAIIVVVSCHCGLNASGGATGVGKSTTKSVVIASLIILVLNFFLTLILTQFLRV
ncbi:MAG: ABC transporter permease [Verrucomicrobiota bacterium]